MWANFNYTTFPIVSVKFSEKIESENEFNEFLKKWTLLYGGKKNFIFIFDTIDVGYINISYCFKMRKFIRNLKKFPHQYLQKSMIIVSNKYMKILLNLIFSVQKPVAKVFIYYPKENEEVSYTNLLQKIEHNDIKDFSIVSP